MEHIYPIFDQILDRKSKEHRLKQHGKVVWLIGLSGSGKSTIAKTIEKKLFAEGFITQLLDGDNLRTGLNGDLGFSATDRAENLRRTAETAKLFKEAGIITFCSFITPTQEARHTTSKIIGNEDYIEVYIDCPVEVCEQRDVKGLYKKARAGEIKDFTGISAPFEEPEQPAVRLKSGEKSLDECVEALYQYILPIISFKE